MDGDDWIEENCIERLEDEQKMENGDIVTGNYRRFRDWIGDFLVHVQKYKYYAKSYTPKEWFRDY